MQRYFATKINNSVELDESDIHHILHVMRMRKSDQIEAVFNNELYLCEIENTSPLKIKILSRLETKCEIPTFLTLFFCLAKGDKIEFVLQKATEIGVKRIVLLNSKRSVVKFDQNDFNKKLQRYNKIVKEAAEQCHRIIIPEICGVYDIKNIPDSLKCEVNYVAYEKVAGSTNNTFSEIDDKKSVSILIGSEGGIDESEINELNKQGFINVSLGNRILRCETAAIYSLSVLSYLLEK